MQPPTTPYPYPYLADNSIRILHLLPDPDGNAPIRCRMTHCPPPDEHGQGESGLFEAQSLRLKCFTCRQIFSVPRRTDGIDWASAPCRAGNRDAIQGFRRAVTGQAEADFRHPRCCHTKPGQKFRQRPAAEFCFRASATATEAWSHRKTHNGTIMWQRTTTQTTQGDEETGKKNIRRQGFSGRHQLNYY